MIEGGSVWEVVQRYARRAILDERQRCIHIIRRERGRAGTLEEAMLLERIEEMIEKGIALGEDR